MKLSIKKFLPVIFRQKLLFKVCLCSSQYRIVSFKKDTASLIFITDLTARLLVVFSHILHTMVIVVVEKLCVSEFSQDITYQGELLSEGTFLLDELHITSCWRLWHKPPRKQNPGGIFNKFPLSVLPFKKVNRA